MNTSRRAFLQTTTLLATALPLANLRLAAWLFPLYLIAINLFVPAIALVGLLRFSDGTPPDLFVLMLPVSGKLPA